MALTAFLPTDYPLLKSIKVKSSSIASDKLGCGYVIDGGKRLVKISPDSTGQRNYNEVSYGNITAVDPTNPFKILVFYKDFATIVLLENTLSQQGTIDLRNLGILQPSAICLTMDNNIWVYDEQEFQLKKINDSGQLISHSENFTNLFNEPSHPDFMIERDNVLYVNDSANGIRVFDIYGAYSKTIPIKGLHHFQVYKDQIIYFQDGKLFSFHTLTLQTKTILLPQLPSSAVDANLQNNVLLVLTDSTVNLYGNK